MDQVKIDGNIVAYGCNMGVTSPTPIIIYCAKPRFVKISTTPKTMKINPMASA